VEAFRGTANEKGVPLIFEPGPDLPAELIGDSGRLRQVLFNVVGNAVKFTEHGRIRVEAVRLKGGINKARLLFSISDTGCGIAEDKLDHIFKPFTQADGSHTRRYQGTGLGLAIVKRLVTLMGGNVHFESEEGRGTTFYLRLDFAVPEPAAEDGISAGEETAGAGDKSGLDVLVVEDDAVNRLTVTRFLEKLGHRAVSAENGAKALEALREGSFDLVLMDIQMPEMDGMEATRRIRAGEADAPAGIPIVAVTAHAMKGDREKFLEVGMNGYLSKPVDIKDLERALNEAAGLESAASD
jgi:CheY-like chemotaxis protein/anti-sigma regulatory factor (Ser/Thr protein kinase)